MIRFVAMLFCILNVCLIRIFSQDATAEADTSIVAAGICRKIIPAAVVYTGGLFYMNYHWHHYDKHTSFHFCNDLSGYLQMDKLQHIYGSYLLSSAGYYWFRNEGLEKKDALKYGATLGFIILSPKEIFDGFYKPGGFSWGDILSNMAGSTLFIVQQMLFDEQIIKCKMSFSRSVYADQSNGYLGKTWAESFLWDLNGHTYWLSANMDRIFLKENMPGYLNIAFGYSANGMFGQYENITSYEGINIPETKRYRQFLLSLDIDWSRIRTKSGFLKTVFKGLNLVKIPFPAVELNSLGKFKGYWLYF